MRKENTRIRDLVTKIPSRIFTKKRAFPTLKASSWICSISDRDPLTDWQVGSSSPGLDLCTMGWAPCKWSRLQDHLIKHNAFSPRRARSQIAIVSHKQPRCWHPDGSQMRPIDVTRFCQWLCIDAPQIQLIAAKEFLNYVLNLVWWARFWVQLFKGH